MSLPSTPRLRPRLLLRLHPVLFATLYVFLLLSPAHAIPSATLPRTLPSLRSLFSPSFSTSTASLLRQFNDVVDEPLPSPSPDASPDPSPEGERDDEVCVEHSYLASNYPVHTLVHADAPVRATVLCAVSHPSLPCMTRHHAVVRGDAHLSMADFCAADGVTCEERKGVLVNSVLSHLWQHEAHGSEEDEGKKVYLTMYDARHPYVLQRALHRAVALRRRLF